MGYRHYARKSTNNNKIKARKLTHMGRLMWIQWAEMLHLQGSQNGSAEKEAFPMRKMAFQEESSIRERSKEFQGNQREGPQGFVGA